jgi:protein arginine N-methyltransferase 1
MYSLADYGRMMADAARMRAYATALERAIRPGSVVVDIGTGAGIFALLACKFGARRVYAIEPDDVIQVARELAAANGYADRIEFLQQLSTSVTLPERADVIVSDIGGALPWFHRHIPSIIDARQRFLTADGVLIPHQDTGWTAIVEAPDTYSTLTAGWDRDRFGLNMDPARQLVINSRSSCRVTREQLLAPIQRWDPLSYRTVEDSDVNAALEFRASRAGIGHGFAAGFDRSVAEGVHLSNAPDAAPGVAAAEIYGLMFFPWPQPMSLREGDHVSLAITARLVGEDYIWRWQTVIRRDAAPDVVETFDQSTFAAAPLSPSQLKKRAEAYTPRLSVEGKAIRLALDLMHRGTTVGDIANQLREVFPERFADHREALDFAADLSRRYG